MPENLRRILKEGLIGGFVAYLAVVLVFALLNALEGRSPFYTAAALGAVLAHGSDAANSFAIEPGPVFAYNGVHMIGSVALGMVASVQIFETELHRSFWYFLLMIWIAAVIYGVVLFGVLGVEIGGVIRWSTAVIGTLAWVGSMTAYFWWVHRGFMGRIQESVEAEA